MQASKVDHLYDACQPPALIQLFCGLNCGYASHELLPFPVVFHSLATSVLHGDLSRRLRGHLG